MNTFVHDDTVWAQNEDGTWSESIPLPYMGLRKSCRFCGAKFFRAKSYQDHYRCQHTDGLAYIRKPEGFLTSYRICRGIDKPLPETLIYRKPSTPEKDTMNNTKGFTIDMIFEPLTDGGYHNNSEDKTRSNCYDCKRVETAKQELTKLIQTIEKKAELYGRLHETIETFQAGAITAEVYSKRHAELTDQINIVREYYQSAYDKSIKSAGNSFFGTSAQSPSKEIEGVE